jgi:hypothetical protein
MSIEQAMISQARPFVVAAKARDLIRAEASKGCRAEISPLPVTLEPNFTPIWLGGKSLKTQQHWVREQSISSEDWVYLQVWISPEQEFSWNQCELFLKQLQTMLFRAGFIISGNNKGITISFLCHRIDLPVISTAFQGEYDLCELTSSEDGFLPSFYSKNWLDMRFRDYFPPQPYSHLLTRPQELQSSPLKSLITAMSALEAPSVGIYQVLLQAVSPEHNWHRNVQILLDFEYTIKLHDGLHSPQRYVQQSPSGDLKQMAWEVENKAHNDKPFYAAALRVALIGAGDKGNVLLSSLATFTSLFQHGGRPLSYLTDQQYSSVLSREQVRDMFILGVIYRPGFLVNSYELAGPVHIPPLSICEHRQIPLEGLETLPVCNSDLLNGTWIGTCSYAGCIQNACIPDGPRTSHTHLIGSSGMGKSTTQEHMILQDIEQGHGVAVLDPHGDLIERLLCLIPERHVERTIYLNPGDPDWVPLWNPLERIPGQDVGRAANNIVVAIKSFVASGGWGDRLENILRNLVFAILHLPQGTFLDISNLLRNKSKESKKMRPEILKVIDNETARQFWLHDYEGYSKTDLGPPINKLGKLLLSDTVSLMLSQPESRFNFRKIMDEGKILLINLSNMDTSVKQVLGCFILSLLHLNALSRSNLPIEDRKQFHIHCDEAHQFMTDTLENLIAETRKYKASLSLSHQYLSQFGKKKTDALSTVGSSVIFNVDKRDAQYLIKDLQEKVKVEELVSLGQAEAIARIGTDIVRIRTRPPLKPPTPNFKGRIITESRNKYYKPVHEVHQWIRHRKDRWNKPFSPLTPTCAKKNSGDLKEFVYDEF